MFNWVVMAIAKPELTGSTFTGCSRNNCLGRETGYMKIPATFLGLIKTYL